MSSSDEVNEALATFAQNHEADNPPDAPETAIEAGPSDVQQDTSPATGPYIGPAEIAGLPNASQEHQPQAPEPPLPQAEPDQDGVSAAFVAQTIEGRSLADDLAAAVGCNNGNGLFSSWEDKVPVLSAAYPVYLHSKSDENAALEEAVKHPPFPALKRRPKTGNPALIAVMLAAKPHTPAERQACSEYATTLIWAAAHEVRPEDFIERVSAKGLKGCKKFVRDLRAKSKQPSAPDTTPPADDTSVKAEHRSEEPPYDQAPKPCQPSCSETNREKASRIKFLMEVVVPPLLESAFQKVPKGKRTTITFERVASTTHNLSFMAVEFDAAPTKVTVLKSRG